MKDLQTRIKDQEDGMQRLHLMEEKLRGMEEAVQEKDSEMRTMKIGFESSQELLQESNAALEEKTILWENARELRNQDEVEKKAMQHQLQVLSTHLQKMQQEKDALLQAFAFFEQPSYPSTRLALRQ